jgi:hypothetical protein
MVRTGNTVNSLTAEEVLLISSLRKLGQSVTSGSITLQGAVSFDEACCQRKIKTL